MKVLQLDLLAFGPFTDLKLDFSGGEYGLHIVYGANEAGKSSALRALHALLFGIPERTTDVFRHDNTSLRIGGRLRHSDGEELCFVRRKGRRNTLLGTDGQPLGDEALDRYLAGVEGGLFKTMFGINHERLVEGSQAILQDSGEVGQSLFSAGLGGAGIRGIITELDAEADELFRPRGQNPAINRAVAEYEAARKDVRNKALSGRDWFEHDRALRRAEKQQHELVQELAKLSTERDGKKRLLLALPNLNRRNHELAQVEGLSSVNLLSEDFPERRRKTVAELEGAREALAGSRAELERSRTKAQDISVPDPVLERADEITNLHQRLGSHRKAVRDRSKLEGQLEQLRIDAEALVVQLRPGASLEDVVSLRPTTALRSRIGELASLYTTNVSSRDHARKHLADLEERRRKTVVAIEEAEDERDGAELARTVAAARRQGDLEDLLGKAVSRRDVDAAQIDVDLERLNMGESTAEELERAALPSAETIDRFEGKLLKIEDEEHRLVEGLEATRCSAREDRRQIEELQRGGNVLSEHDLKNAREQRDQCWQLVRRAWTTGEDVTQEAKHFDAELDLADAYEKSVHGADEVSDRLRREADRVAKMAELIARVAETTEQQSRLEVRRGETSEHLERTRSEWKGLWSGAGVEAGSPREMRAWTSRKDRLVERIENHREHDAGVRRVAGLIAGHRSALSAALEGLKEARAADGESLDVLLDRCIDVTGQIDDTRRRRLGFEQRRTELDGEILLAQSDLEGANDAVRDWQTEWAAVVKTLGLTGDSLPAEAAAVLEGLDDLFSKTTEIQGKDRRIQSIDRDAREFEQELKVLVEGVARELAAIRPEEAAERLNSMLSEAKSDAAILKSLKEQIDAAKDACAEAEQTIEFTSRRLSELCAEAGCSGPDELPEAEQRSADLRSARSKLLAVEEQLVEQSGLALEMLIAEAEGANSAELQVEINELDRRIAELEEQRSGLDQDIGSERQILEAMDGGDQSAVAAERAQSKLAEIRTQVHRYMRLRLASAVLQREIERYRSQNQAPLLRRAGELFAALTVGSFDRLETAYDKNDQPILEGVRESGTSVGVAGMSSGTRDQLYLALRLASLEKYLLAGEPMPFVVDDILMSFDDRRAAAALQVLGELSRRTQVLFFTHHQRLVELANNAASDVVVYHEF